MRHNDCAHCMNTKQEFQAKKQETSRSGMSGEKEVFGDKYIHGPRVKIIMIPHYYDYDLQ